MALKMLGPKGRAGSSPAARTFHFSKIKVILIPQRPIAESGECRGPLREAFLGRICR